MTELETKLADLIRTSDTVSGEDFDLNEVGLRCMDEAERYSWQSFVPLEIRAVWPALSVETRLAVCYIAQRHAYAFEPDFG